MKKVALVFRTIGERTSDLALELAKENIQPDEVHVLDGMRPFSEAVRRMIEIEYDADFVVAVDADSLILSDMRPWLETNERAYVDCYVHDRFRGRIHCGVHVTRIDVVRAMRAIEPPVAEESYVLRPESRMRKLALNELGYPKCFKTFPILHDHFQYLRDVWAKYALRELRSRTEQQRRQLDAAIERWAREPRVVELRVAREAVAWAQRELPPGTPPEVLAEAIARLPELGAAQIAALGIEELGPLSRDEVMAFAAEHRRRWPAREESYPVFGLGLSRTGTRSLTAALHVLGIDTVHYPVDEDTFRALSSGKLDFQLLESFDGITDITAAPYYAQLDRMHPDARFILTVRDEVTWLRSCETHWRGRDAFEEALTPGRVVHLKIRRFLRAATYGTYEFEPERFAHVRRRHVRDVQRHFAGREGKLLVLDIVGGEGWGSLCEFLGRPIPDQLFPHKGGALSAKLQRDVGDPDD